MLFVTVAIIILLALLDRSVRYSRIDLLLYSTRFRLFKLRDELRLAVIDGKVAKNEWFDYFDTTITKVIDNLANITIWEASILLFNYKDNESILDAQIKLMEFLKKEENAEIDLLYKKFLAELARFLFRRHRVMSFSLIGLSRLGDKLVNYKEKMPRILVSAPETSTLLKYT